MWVRNTNIREMFLEIKESDPGDVTVILKCNCNISQKIRIKHGKNIKIHCTCIRFTKVHCVTVTILNWEWEKNSVLYKEAKKQDCLGLSSNRDTILCGEHLSASAPVEAGEKEHNALIGKNSKEGSPAKPWPSLKGAVEPIWALCLYSTLISSCIKMPS